MKKVLYVLIVCIMCFVSVNVKALPDKLSLSRLDATSHNDVVNGSQEILSGYEAQKHPFYFVYKYAPYNSVNYIAFCTGNPGHNASFGTNTYSQNSVWSDEIGAGVAAIIVNGVGEGATISQYPFNDINKLIRLYETQVAIWKYLNDKSLFSGEYLDLSYTMDSMSANNPDMYENVKDLANDMAHTAERNFSRTQNFSPTLSQSNLNFEKSGDEYVSDTIKINGEGIDSINVNASNGVEVYGDKINGYYFVVSADKVTQAGLSVSIDFNLITKRVPIARNYSPSSSSNQTVTITMLDYRESISKTLTISEKINYIPTDTSQEVTAELSILKVDENGKGLMGATLKLLDSNENVVKICKDLQNNLVDCIWETTTNTYNIEDVKPGTYYLYEESAPKGYDLLLNPIVIVVSNNGKITANGKTVSDGLIKVSNSLTRTKINKLGAIEGEQLTGAILQILNSDGKEMSCTLIDEQGNISNNDKCMWNTGKEPKIILGLEKGKYYLTELSAPNGYELNKEKIEFEVKTDGQTTEVTMKNNLKVEVPDTLSSRSTLLLTVGTLLIFVGTSIITQILKRAKKEF